MLVRRSAVGALVVANVAVLLATEPPYIPLVYSAPSAPIPVALTAEAPDAQLSVAGTDLLADHLELEFHLENSLSGTGYVEVYRSGTPWEGAPSGLPDAVVPIHGAWGGPAATEATVAIEPDYEVADPAFATVYVWLALTGDGVEAVGEIAAVAAAHEREDGWVPEAPVLE